MNEDRITGFSRRQEKESTMKQPAVLSGELGREIVLWLHDADEDDLVATGEVDLHLQFVLTRFQARSILKWWFTPEPKSGLMTA